MTVKVIKRLTTKAKEHLHHPMSHIHGTKHLIYINFARGRNNGGKTFILSSKQELCRQVFLLRVPIKLCWNPIRQIFDYMCKCETGKHIRHTIMGTYLKTVASETETEDDSLPLDMGDVPANVPRDTVG